MQKVLAQKVPVQISGEVPEGSGAEPRVGFWKVPVQRSGEARCALK